MSEPFAASTHPFTWLSPARVLDAVEDAGFECDGSLLALNSFENRVYQVGRVDEQPLVAKFYRPGRWSDSEILEEHAFLAELAEAELPVAAPIRDREGSTLISVRLRPQADDADSGLAGQDPGFRMALFPRLSGRAVELESREHLEWLGRLIARVHQVGAARPFRVRPPFSIERLGVQALADTLAGELLPESLRLRYQRAGEALLERVRRQLQRPSSPRRLRLHGDLHRGNLLWNDAGPLFLDFDDCCEGPAIQDLWMLLPGDDEGQAEALDALREGYELFRRLDPAELGMIEALRALRLLHHGGWLSARYGDPAFPLAFPYAGQARFWEEHLRTLEEQLERV